MKRDWIYILTLIAGIILTSCSEEKIIPDGRDNTETLVRLQATINMTAGEAQTRTAGTVDESNSDYNESTENGNSDENAVGKIRVLAFDLTAETIVKNKLFQQSEFTFAAGTTNLIQLDMQMWPGSYKFVLVTNEETGWNLDVINNYTELTTATALSNITNQITTTAELTGKVSEPSGIPMIGEANLVVQTNPGATSGNPQLVTPKIELERTIAKIELSIRNTDDNDDVYETAKPYTIKSYQLINAKQNYNLFKGNNTTVPDVLWGFNKVLTHSKGAPFNQKVHAGYMAERKNVTKDEATTVRITVDNEGTEFTYDIPVFQYEDAGKTKKNYDIRRNTIYRLNTRLEGEELGYELNVYTAVEGWKEVIIGVVDPEFYGYMLHFDRKTIYVDGGTSGNYSDMITYFTPEYQLAYSGYESDIAGIGVVHHYDDDNRWDSGNSYFILTIPRSKVPTGQDKYIRLKFEKVGKEAEPLIIVTIVVRRH